MLSRISRSLPGFGVWKTRGVTVINKLHSISSSEKTALSPFCPSFNVLNDHRLDASLTLDTRRINLGEDVESPYLLG